MGEDRALTPWWLEEAPQIEPEPALDGELEVDIAVVGGGYTGLWTALALRELEPLARVVMVLHRGDGAPGIEGCDRRIRAGSEDDTPLQHRAVRVHRFRTIGPHPDLV